MITLPKAPAGGKEMAFAIAALCLLVAAVYYPVSHMKPTVFRSITDVCDSTSAIASFESPRPVPAGKWVHVAGTFDGNALRAYVDGEEVKSRARYISGGVDRNMIWRSRNADGPLRRAVCWEDPLAPTSTIAIRGREVTYATRGDRRGRNIEQGRCVSLYEPGSQSLSR